MSSNRFIQLTLQTGYAEGVTMNKPDLIPIPPTTERKLIWCNKSISDGLNYFYIDSLDFSSPVNLSFEGYQLFFLIISNDGKKVFYSKKLPADLNYKTYFADIDKYLITNEVELNVDSFNITYVQFGVNWVDNGKILFNSNNDIYLANLNDNSVIMITPNATNTSYYSVFYSKSDNKVYYSSRVATGYVSISRCDVDGTNHELVIPANRYNQSVIINDSGNKLYLFRYDVDGLNTRLYVYDFNSELNSLSNEMFLGFAPEAKMSANLPIEEDNIWLNSHNGGIWNTVPSPSYNSNIYKYSLIDQEFVKMYDPPIAGDASVIIGFFDFSL